MKLAREYTCAVANAPQEENKKRKEKKKRLKKRKEEKKITLGYICFLPDLLSRSEKSFNKDLPASYQNY